MRSGIVLAGTVVLDIVNMIERWPDEEQIAFIHDSIPAAGGPPHNASAALLKLRAPFPVTVIGVVGDDAHGETFLAAARANGLDTSSIYRVSGATTDYTHVMTSMATGKRTFFFQPGANGTLAAEQLLPPDDQAKIYYLGSPGLSSSMDRNDGWRQALGNARTRGFLTAMELCPVRPDVQRMQVRPCLPLLDYFIVNDSEAEAVSDVQVTANGHFDWAAAERACRQLLDLGVNRLVAIHHPEGAVAVNRDGEVVHAASVRVPALEIIGTVGAGDAFYAGMLLGLHEEWPLAQCLALANASAATSLHASTTVASIRPWQDCLAYARECGLRSSK